jgi:hypothetical protein
LRAIAIDANLAGKRSGKIHSICGDAVPALAASEWGRPVRGHAVAVVSGGKDELVCDNDITCASIASALARCASND